MKTVSVDFKQQIKNLSVSSSGEVVISDGITALSFTDDDLLKIEISASSKNNGSNIGVIAPYNVVVELLGDKTQLLDLTVEKTLVPKIGILVGSVYEYVEYQTFIIVEMNYNDTTNVTKIYAADYTYKLNKEYIDSNVYPISLLDYAKNVIEYCGLTMYNSSILNGSFILTEQPIENLTTCREIVASIAQLALCFVSTNVSNQLVFNNSFQTYDSIGSTYNFLSQFTYNEMSLYTYDELVTIFSEESIDDISKDTYWNLKLLENSYKTMGVNTLTLKISQVEGENNSISDEEKVLVDGSIEVAIEDNPFINTEEKRLAVINDMFDVVNGYKNVPFNIEYRGFPYLELNDLVEITLMNDSIFLPCIDEIYVLYNGGLSGKLKTYAITPADTKYKNKPSLDKRVRRTEIMVDKANNEIILLAEDLNSVEAKLEPEAFTITVQTITNDQFGETISNVNKNFIFNADGLEINNSINDFAIKIDETEMGFYDGGTKIAYMNNNELRIKQGVVETNLIIGVHKIEKFNNNITVFRYIGEE